LHARQAESRGLANIERAVDGSVRNHRESTERISAQVECLGVLEGPDIHVDVRILEHSSRVEGLVSIK
jgi:hypothetical protein